MRMLAVCVLSLSAFALTGCLGLETKGPEETSDRPMTAPEIFQAQPGLTPKERWKKALDLLQVGEAGQARAELAAYLRERPGRKRAIDLIEQIDSDPVAYLGEDYFLYRMERGDSLSIVAKRMLGDPLKFHALARYNGIENPSKMVVGQTIKVPGTEPPAMESQVAAVDAPAVETLEPGTPLISEEEAEMLEAADEVVAAEGSASGLSEADFADTEPGEAELLETEPPETAIGEAGAADDQSASEEGIGTQEASLDFGTGVEGDANGETDETSAKAVILETDPPGESGAVTLDQLMTQAVEKAQQGDFVGASDTYEEAVKQYPDAYFVKQQAALNYLTYADTLETKGDREQASVVLVRARQLDPQNQEVEQRLGRFAKLDEADALYQEGTSYQANDDVIQAYKSYQRAVDVVPDHSLANKKLLVLTPVVAKEYYRRGLRAFQRQELDEAIAMYDECLTVDPGFASCSVKRLETVELKESLGTVPD